MGAAHSITALCFDFIASATFLELTTLTRSFITSEVINGRPASHSEWPPETSLHVPRMHCLLFG